MARYLPTLRFVCLMLLGSLTIAGVAIADDGPNEEEFAASYEESDFEDSGTQFSFDDDTDPDYWLVNQPGADAATPAPTRSRSLAASDRRRRSTYRLPSMFGDFYGGSLLQARIQLPSTLITQTFVDNVGMNNFFVTNNNGGQGSDPNPAVGIQVRLFDGSGPVIASSIGPQAPFGQSVGYAINEPNLPGSPPAAPGPGTIVYVGGTAFYAGNTPPGPNDNGEGWGIETNHQFTPDPVLLNLPSGGGAVRRVKIAENNSPIPRDRFIFNYNFFNDVIGGIGDVNRYAVGFEHTLLTDNSSIEVLMPMASTLNVDQIAGGMRSTDTEFGDLSVIFKTILWEGEACLIAGGLGLTVPTGDDARVFNTSGQQILDLEHRSTHLLPYLAALHVSETGWYWQAFMQLDLDLNGNPIRADMNGSNLQSVGVLQDQTLLFVDVGMGYWLRSPGEGTPAVAATAELHWASTLQDADAVNANGLNLTSNINRYDVLNLSLGASVLVNDSFTIRPAMVIPLADDDGEQFDYEAMVQMNFWR